MVEGSAADQTREAGAWPEESEFESGSAPRLIRSFLTGSRGAVGPFSRSSPGESERIHT